VRLPPIPISKVSLNSFSRNRRCICHAPVKAVARHYRRALGRASFSLKLRFVSPCSESIPTAGLLQVGLDAISVIFEPGDFPYLSPRLPRQEYKCARSGVR